MKTLIVLAFALIIGGTIGSAHITNGPIPNCGLFICPPTR